MKIVAINGSPRNNGNTGLLLEAMLAPLRDAEWDTETIRIGGSHLHGCRACRTCFERQDLRCRYEDDEFNSIYEKILAADALVIGSPTYVADVTSETKALIDRTAYVTLANGAPLAGKIGAGVIALRRGGGVHALDSINHFFLICQMIIPGSRYWNLGFGREPGAVAEDAEGMANMKHLGQAIAWLGKAIRGGGEPYPLPE